MANKRHPFTANLTLTVADTEYSYEFPQGTVSIYLKARSNYRIKASWQEGQSGSVYMSIGEGSSLSEDGLYIQGRAALKIYAQCSVAGEVLELSGWRE